VQQEHEVSTNRESKPGMSSRFDSIPSAPGSSPAFLFSGKRATWRSRLVEILEKPARWVRWDWGWRIAAAGLLAGPALAVPPLVQLPGMADCVSETGTGSACSDGVALIGAVSAAVSPDGRNVYVASSLSDAVAVFDRDAATGTLTQKAGTAGCVSETGTSGACADGVALLSPVSVAVSPDGRSVYLVAAVSDAVVVFDRDAATGALNQKSGTAGCVSESGTGGACAAGVALDFAAFVAVSPDGRTVYVASRTSSAVAVFDRDVATGALTQKSGAAGCVSETGTEGACADGVALITAASVAVSPDGRNVYVSSLNSDAVAVFDRDAATGALAQKAGTAGCISETGTGGSCADGVALTTAASVAVSPDGRTVYVASRSSSAVAVFDRNAATGALTQKAGSAGCLSETGTDGACADASALDGPTSVAVSPDGRSVYLASFDSNAVAVFDRDAATAALAQKAGTARCVSETGFDACTQGVALDGPFTVTVSPDGRSVYLASAFAGAVAAFTRDVPTDDIDDDGDVDALTDGLLKLRYLFGFRGESLVDGAVDLADCRRCVAADIESYIQALQGL
jgi:DNA-binding beta-propeller fold protein YncE